MVNVMRRILCYMVVVCCFCLFIAGCSKKEKGVQDAQTEISTNNQGNIQDAGDEEEPQTSDTETAGNSSAEKQSEENVTTTEQLEISKDSWESEDVIDDSDNIGTVTDTEETENNSEEENTSPSLSTDGDVYLPLLP